METSDMLKSLNKDNIKKEKLQSARVIVLEGSKKGEEMKVMFNPSQYALTDQASYKEAAAAWKDNPFLNYQGGKASTLEMELFFDTGAVKIYGKRGVIKATDVSQWVRRFTDLVYIDAELHAPPVVKFVWGSLSFRGVITSVKSRYVCFTESGMPTQARVNVSFKAAPEKNEKRKSPFESPDRTKCQMVREDYSIWDMAQNEYKDVSKWKLIARANGIANPLDIPPGTMLKIPAL